jgi:hypothetical protein
MKKFASRFLLAAGLLACGLAMPAAARDDAVVDSVQMPAWVERHGAWQPLEPGMALRNRDRLLTGADARVLIALAEGSAVKLGENSRLDINALGRRDNRVFTAAFDLASGALRFTSGVFPSPREQRAINLRIATITAGVRGTDLWGKADQEGDLLCLLAGRISVFHAQGEPLEMDQALSVYAAAKGAAPDPLGRADPGQFEAWAAQTEVQPGSGYARRGGAWKVELATVAGPAEALALYDRARAAGYAVRIKPRGAEGGGYRYTVRLGHLPSQAEAMVLAEKLRVSLDLAAPTATRR